MKILKSQLKVLAVVLLFSLPWVNSQALENFMKAGVITSVGYDKFTLQSREYRFAPGAKINSSDASRKKFSDFRQGDKIYFEGIILNGVYYVNIIYYETPTPS